MAGNKPDDPARRVDAGFIAADASLAIRYLLLAINALRRGDEASFEKSMAGAETQAEDLWAKYKEFLAEDGDGV